MNFEPIKSEISKFSLLTATSFSTQSWAKYSENISALTKELDRFHFIYFREDYTVSDCEEAILDHFTSLTISTKQSHQELISIERYNHLKNLCNENRDRTTIKGCETKLTLLLSAVSKGEDCLRKNDATPADIEKAIADIESSKTDLLMSESELKLAQAQVIEQDIKTVRMIVIFASLSIALAVIFACVVSVQFFGRIDWKK
jgi:hypothetical protein